MTPDELPTDMEAVIAQLDEDYATLLKAYQEQRRALEEASPVVPVGIGERVRLIVSGLINGFTDFTVAEREAFIDRKTDAILAALRPTDAGRE
jgi:hypothetical protein